MFEVYLHTAPSGKRYVGYSVHGVAWRWRKHVTAARFGSPLPFHRAIRKYGPASFRSELLERMSTEAGAKHAERLWIKRLGTFGAGGYNATAGGEGPSHAMPWNKGKKMSAEACARNAAAQRGRKHTAETIARMRSTRAKSEVKARMSAAHVGKKHSAETRALMSAAHTHRSPEAKAKCALAMKGRKHRPDTIEKMRASHLRRSRGV
jgi:group I intron endonuclease